MRPYRLAVLFLLLATAPGIAQKVPNFKKDLERYFHKARIDSVEGLYTISDDITVVTPWYDSTNSNEHRTRDHWAKVALVRDSTSLTRDYMELTIQTPGFEEGELRAEYLRTRQNSHILISKQLSKDRSKIETMLFEHEGEMLVAKFEYKDGENVVKLTRTYLKYYPRK